MAKVFVSYSHHDHELASRVIACLRKLGHTPISDQDLLHIGADWRVVLGKALKDCPIFLSVFTKNSISAPYPISDGRREFWARLLFPFCLMESTTRMLLQTSGPCVLLNRIWRKCSNVCTDISKLAAENKKVFIVHGQNEAKKLELKDFLAKLALDPMILHQQNDLGKTIIEKFEYYAAQCAFPWSC